MQTIAPLARVLVDESHAQAWTIRPDAAQLLQPSHPEDSSYAGAAKLLRHEGFAVAAHTDGALDFTALDHADVLVLPHFADARWERVLPGTPKLSTAEIDAIEQFVANGGGLLVLAECEHDKYDNNLQELLARFGCRLGHDTVSDYTRHDRSPHWILPDLASDSDGVLAGVNEVCFYRAGTIGLLPREARVIARAGETSSAPGAPLAALIQHGEGRVAVLTDSDLFGDDCLGDVDNAKLLRALAHWAGHGALVKHLPVTAGATSDPAWLRLREATERLRKLQNADGSLRENASDSGAAGLVDTITAAIAELEPRFEHQADHLRATVGDLRTWVSEGFGVPDFRLSLELFRPDLHRGDGIEHLVVFPMYKQNGSRDRVFESLIVRVPWPEWLDELERTRYQNPKFVPVTFVDYTSGYDSECAVLFPETISVAGAPANNFGAIFCDREAERFRRVAGAAADLLSLELPPDAQSLLASERISQEAYMLWDLVHDRAHSHGDLPFDPFMVRQRMPYWMYSLEELRCDLTAFAEAVALKKEGFAFARFVQYAILFDRLFRFPITGSRVKNYDGLGGQLLFAYLHRRRDIRWTDNRLSVSWDTVADGVAALREEILELYRSGIDRSKLAQWGAAHDLVSRYVPAATGSNWMSEVRAYREVEDPRPYIDEVLDDEFPLSMFYVQLKAKLAKALERPREERLAA
jgi:hypothetical protein